MEEFIGENGPDINIYVKKHFSLCKMRIRELMYLYITIQEWMVNLRMEGKGRRKGMEGGDVNGRGIDLLSSQPDQKINDERPPKLNG
jgi:hypothetical protein